MLTPDQPQYSTPFNVNSPLSVGFMTQGQMGYLPQQQYLTPSEYGAFRTLPSTNVNNLYVQRPGIIQNIAYAHGGMLGGVPIPTYNPAVNAMQRQTMAQRGIRDQLSSWGGTALDATMMGLSMLHPATALLSMVAPNFGANMVDIHAQMRNIQSMSTPKITFGSGVSGGLGLGFSGSSALSIEKGIRKMAAGDPFYKLDDYRKIMQKGMEYDMFDYSNSADSYKKVMKRLRNQTDAMLAHIDNKDVESVMKNLKRLQDMGAHGDIATAVAGQEAMFARMTGMRHTDMVNSYGQQGALIYSQYGMTGYQGALSAMGTAAQLTMAQRMGLVSPDLLARNGGLSGFTQKITEEGAAGMVRTADQFLPYLANKDFTGIDSSKIQAMLSGKMDIFKVMTEGATKAGADVTGFSSFLTNKDQLLKDLNDKLGTLGKALFELIRAQQIGQGFGITGMHAQVSRGLQEMGYSPQSARTLADMYTNREFLSGLQQQQTRERSMFYAKGMEQYKDKESLWYKMKTVPGSFIQDLASPFYAWKSRREEAADWKEAINNGVYGVSAPSSGSGSGYDYSSGTDISPYTSQRHVGTGELPDLSKDIGEVAKKYESAGGTREIGYDSGGGTSYGPYQIASKLNWDSFLSYLEKHGGPDGKQAAAELRAAGSGNTGSDKGKPVRVWRKLRREGKITDDLLFNFSRDTHYNVSFGKLKSTKLQKLINKNTALQASLFSTSNQYGPAGGADIFNEAYVDGMSSAQLIQAVQGVKYNRPSAKALGLEDRITKERDDLLALIALEKAGISKDSAGAQSVIDKALDSGEYTLPPSMKKYIQELKDIQDPEISYSENSSKAFGDMAKAYGFDVPTSNKRSETQKKIALARASLMSDDEAKRVLGTYNITAGEFKTQYRAILAGAQLGTEEYASNTKRLLKTLVKGRFPDLSEEQLSEKVNELLEDKDMQRLLLREYGAQNPDQLDAAKKYSYESEKRRLAAQTKDYDKKVGDWELSLEKYLKKGGRESAKFLIDANKKTGKAFHLANMQRKLILYNSSTDAEQARLRPILEEYASKALGIGKEEFEEMLENGSITYAKSTGHSAEELETLERIAIDNPKALFAYHGSKAATLTSAHKYLTGLGEISKYGIKEEDLQSYVGLKKIAARKDLPQPIQDMVAVLSGATEKNLQKGDLTEAAISKLVPGAGARTVDVTPPLAEGDKSSTATLNTTDALLSAYLKNFEEHNEKLGENTKSLDKLADAVKKTTSFNNLLTSGGFGGPNG